MNEIKSLNLNHIVNIQEIRKENNILNINEKFYVNGNIENLDIEQSQIYLIIRELLLCLYELHNNKIINGNLKPSNIIMNDENDELLLDDLFLSNYRNIRVMSFDYYHYISPEQISNKEIDERSDIFNLGLIIYRLYFNEDLLKSKSFLGLFKEIKKINTVLSDKNNKIKSSYNHLLKMTLENDKEKRISIESLYKILVDYSFENLSNDSFIKNLSLSYDFCKNNNEKVLLFNRMSKSYEIVMKMFLSLSEDEIKDNEELTNQLLFYILFFNPSIRPICNIMPISPSFKLFLKIIDKKESILISSNIDQSIINKYHYIIIFFTGIIKSIAFSDIKISQFRDSNIEFFYKIESLKIERIYIICIIKIDCEIDCIFYRILIHLLMKNIPSQSIVINNITQKT